MAHILIEKQTQGYDGAMMRVSLPYRKVLLSDSSHRNALNILPSYTDYFALTTATLALNTSAVYLGSLIAVIYGPVIDYLGRKKAMFWASVITLIAVVLQAASQNVAMFVISRILIGVGIGASSIAGPVYLAETLSVKWRGWGLGLFYDFWYIGKYIRPQNPHIISSLSQIIEDKSLH